MTPSRRPISLKNATRPASAPAPLAPQSGGGQATRRLESQLSSTLVLGCRARFGPSASAQQTQTKLRCDNRRGRPNEPQAGYRDLQHGMPASARSGPLAATDVSLAESDQFGTSPRLYGHFPSC